MTDTDWSRGLPRATYDSGNVSGPSSSNGSPGVSFGTRQHDVLVGDCLIMGRSGRRAG